MAKTAAPRKKLPKSTAQQLGSIVKSCRDIMRKDKGLNGDLDRLPMLTWIMFLKFLDDMEQVSARQEAKLAGKRYQPSHRTALPLAGLGGKARRHHRRRTHRLHQSGRSHAPRWQERARAVCLPASPRESRTATRRDVIATVFQGAINRMVNGYLLRDVINKVNDIHFTSKDEIHTLGRAVRIHAPRNARCRGRFRRILHAARRRAVHGRRQ